MDIPDQRIQVVSLAIAAIFVSMLITPATLIGQSLEEMSLERWQALRETERYQLQIAEKLYREQNYKVALAEYEKYLSLYERSEAASHVQLKWSLCQLKLRKANTAINEGFRSVIDYWPDSADAVAAAYYIGSTYQSMGQIREAKKAFNTVISDYEKQAVAAVAMNKLATIAIAEQDEKTFVEIWKRLTFDTRREPQTKRICIDASHNLARHYFLNGAFDEAVKVLETTYHGKLQTVQHVMHFVRQPLSKLSGQSKTKQQADDLAKKTIAYLRENMPAATDEKSKQLAREYWYNIASVHAHARHDDEARKTYEAILKQFGEDDTTLGKLAQWYQGKGKFDDARSTFRRFKDTVAGLTQVAGSYRQERKTDLAVKTYQQLIGKDADHQIRWKAEMAATYREVKKYENAIAIYEELVAEDLKNEQRWRWQIATAYQDWGKYVEAIAQYRVCTNFPENYKRMAQCNRHIKKYGEAIVLYNQVLADQSSAPWALLQIGYTHEQAGQSEQAIKSFQVVCKKFPKSGYASQAHAHLQNKYKISVTLGGAKDE